MTCRCLNCILPPHMLEHLAGSDRPELRAAAMRTLLTTSELRGERSVRATFFGVTAPPWCPAAARSRRSSAGRRSAR